MNTFTSITTIDILVIITTIVIACSGLYLILLLRHLNHISHVLDRFAHMIEQFQDTFSIFEKIPTNIFRQIMDHLSLNKK